MMSFAKRLVVVSTLLLLCAPTQAAFLPTAPKGYKVSEFGTAASARQMALSPKGYLYVGSLEAGVLSVIRQGKTTQLLKDLNLPSGILLIGADLYVAEVGKLSVIRGIDASVEKGEALKLETIKGDFPTDQHHGWKYLALGPDKKIYIPVGAPCNVCLPVSPYGALHRIDQDGKNFETLATGIRNTTGFDFHPTTKELWFTEHGRDMMGDNVPPDEINILKVGAHYGYPFQHASKVKDPHYFHQMPKGLVTTPPVGEIQAHSAPVGIRFIGNTPFSKDFPGCFFISLHGSWNRSSKVGYEVAVGCPDKSNQVKKLRPFLTGFLKGPTVNGRPTDLMFMPDGSLLVADDHAGKVWRVEKTK